MNKYHSTKSSQAILKLIRRFLGNTSCMWRYLDDQYAEDQILSLTSQNNKVIFCYW